jgi:MFS family permease
MALWALAWLGSTPIGGPIVGWVGQSVGARWSLVLGGLPTVICGILALPALSRIDRRVARTRGHEETSGEAASPEDTSPEDTSPEETSDDHSPAISSVSPAG